jgi:hypothetical protein
VPSVRLHADNRGRAIIISFHVSQIVSKNERQDPFWSPEQVHGAMARIKVKSLLLLFKFGFGEHPRPDKFYLYSQA